MPSKHVTLGIIIVAGVVIFMVGRYLRRPRQRLSAAGWLGLAVIVAAEVLLTLQAKWVTIYFTPLAWSGYILLADSMVASLEGTSRLRESPRGFLALVICSVPLWLIFEAVNLRLKNWAYVGLPASALARDAGYAWAFATIWPAIYETADLVKALRLTGRRSNPHAPISLRTLAAISLAGLVCISLPVMLPARIGSYLFGMVWIGFALLLDPLNYHWGGRSVLREWENGSTDTLKSFLLSGVVCGFLWEFWNYWAHARWVYIFPIFQHWKIFEMPAPGFLGFPPFAVECMAMFEFLRTATGRIQGAFRQPARLAAVQREQ